MADATSVGVTSAPVRSPSCSPSARACLMTIGRSSDATLQLDSDSVSRLHARLTVRTDGWVQVVNFAILGLALVVLAIIVPAPG